MQWLQSFRIKKHSDAFNRRRLSHPRLTTVVGCLARYIVNSFWKHYFYSVALTPSSKVIFWRHSPQTLECHYGIPGKQHGDCWER